MPELDGKGVKTPKTVEREQSVEGNAKETRPGAGQGPKLEGPNSPGGHKK